MAIAVAALTLAVGYETSVREIQKSISSVNIDMKNSIFGQSPALGNITQHRRSTELRANIRTGKQGLGLIIIQNGPYLQIMCLVEKSSAAKDGKLKPGDVLIKIGHADVLGCTLQELRKILRNIPVGTTLQIRVYRNFIEVPQHWQSAVELIPEVKLPVMTEDTSEDTEEEDIGTSSDDDTDLETFRYTSSQSSCSEFTHELSSIYKSLHVSDTIQTLTEGRNSGCDIALHNYVDALCNSEFDASGVGPPPYRTVENSETSSSSHSSV
ncbi:PDZ domain-containing protein 9 [Anas acuta]|uniref:PDZ domain-containing protein 9 n=1 Tax=Anas acuta TaxID=28680 RepID=UPI0035C8DC91